jgi:hypothetical protein
VAYRKKQARVCDTFKGWQLCGTIFSKPEKVTSREVQLFGFKIVETLNENAM